MTNIFHELLESGEALQLALDDQDIDRFDQLVRDRESLLSELTSRPRPEHPSQEWREMARRLAEQEKALMVAAVALEKAMADRLDVSARRRSANQTYRSAGAPGGLMTNGLSG